LLVRGGGPDAEAGSEVFQQVKKDLAFAPAYAGLLDEFLAEGHAAMGFIYSRRFDWPSAEKSFRRAIDLNPGLTQTPQLLDDNPASTRKLDEAERLRLLTVAMRTDPLSAPVVHELGFMKLIAGRFDDAMDHYTRARAHDPSLPYVDQHFGRALTFAGLLGSDVVLGR
jgi:tetratricopeptide (TPR) repeat protein